MKAGGVPTGLKFEIAPSYDALSRRAADVIVAELKQKPDLLLCASAGGTPTGTYERLAHKARSQPRLFGNMHVLQIDEWGGLDPGHPATCEADLRTKLLDPLRIGKDRYFGFKTDTADPAAQCARMARWLSRNGPVDLCILGLGLNGHIAMNEPGESLAPHTHVAQLAPGSLKHPMLAHSPRKPRFGLTIGMADILASKLILLLINGRHKRATAKRLLQQHVTTQFPASFLWLHPRAIALLDREAAPNPR
jgi:galactosamine-6-phosphate isomerase